MVEEIEQHQMSSLNILNVLSLVTVIDLKEKWRYLKQGDNGLSLKSKNSCTVFRLSI